MTLNFDPVTLAFNLLRKCLSLIYSAPWHHTDADVTPY